MDRRESMKSLLIGSLAGGLALNGCSPLTDDGQLDTPETDGKFYGRTPEEILLDEKLMEERFFTVHELETIATLCDLILPAKDQFGSALEAGVPEFMEFMAKDIPEHQVPLRGGIMWLDSRSNKKFNLAFKSCNIEQQKELMDEIAYPEKAASELRPGVEFFSLMRDLTITGYYTTRMGLNELEFKGNQPNVWDGVPEEVLKDHTVTYDPEWIAKCINQETRNETAQWDDDGNLLT